MRRYEWFGDWFASPYYFILYKNRDNREAQFFIDNLLELLSPITSATFMDLACGKGRHSIYLNSKGFDVTGLDLQQGNVAHANQFANEKLRFFEHDMRKVFKIAAFDYVFNLFTSFGYFDTKAEHLQTIEAVSKSLKPGGKFVLDFLNPYTVVNNLAPEETKTLEGIHFHIRKYFDGEFILKDISFEDEGKSFQFQEKVKAIRRVEFLEYFEKAGLKLLEVFGSYQLNKYDPDLSDRLIFVVQK